MTPFQYRSDQIFSKITQLKEILLQSNVNVSSSGEVKVTHVHDVHHHPIDLNVIDQPSRYNLRDLSVAVGCHARNDVLNHTLLYGLAVSHTSK